MADVLKKGVVRVRESLLRRTSGLSEPSSAASTSPESEHPRDPPKNTRKSSFPGFGRSSTKDKRDERRSSITPANQLEQVAVAEQKTPAASSANGDVNAADPSTTQPLSRPPTLLVQAPSSPELRAEHKLPNGQPQSSNNQLESLEHPEASHLPTSPSRQSFTRPPLTRTSTRGSYIGNTASHMSGQNTRPSTRDSEVNENFVDAVQAQPKRMSRRRVWVQRPGASATLVQYHEDDLVDDVRDTIIRKYANSLGRTVDSPDITLKIQPRERSGQERDLSVDEPMASLLDAYYPGGQHVSEALLINVPQKRTPRASPRIVGVRQDRDLYEETRPSEDDAGYFPPMPVAGQLTPQGRNVYTTASHPHSIAILETGQAPPLPSPREKRTRPRPHRQHTSSPTVLTSGGTKQATQTLAYHTPRQNRVRRDSNDVIKGAAHAPQPPPLPTSPSQEVPAAALTASGKPVGTPPAVSHPAVAAVSPRLPPNSSTKKRTRKSMARHQTPPTHGFAPPAQGKEGQVSVPPINVLIVEDNIINLKVLEMMVGRLKVRWATAMNGRDAVTKWREGGFHLVLMDIQLPIMSGLEATKEIRRLERVNGIGVFAREEDDDSTGKPSGIMGHAGVNGDGTVPVPRRPSKDTTEEDQLGKGGLFKSPVIIVALTASSLQSDRREALAAGCNDFLTKPVNFPWFSQKVTEWGCMQALIDFDGWRAWKNLSEAAEMKKLKERDQESEEDRKKREKKEEKEKKRLELLKKMGK